MRRLMRIVAAFAAALAIATPLSSCTNPEYVAAQAEAIVGLTQEVTNLQAIIMQLEVRIDSLVGASASQDTAIARTAAFVGLVLPGRER